MIKKKLKLTSAIVASILLSCLSLSSIAYASPSINALSSIGSCSTTSNSSYSTTMQQLPESGSIYVRLSNNLETSSNLTLYFQSLSTGKCNLIGTAIAKYGSWTKIGSFNNSNNKYGGLFIIYGNGLGAEPYASVAKLLILPDPSLCTPTTNCNIDYNGYTASLTPKIISGASDQIAIFLASSIVDAKINSIGYYDNNQYVYGRTTFAPFNNNYLQGGKHNTSVQIVFNNGETLSINKTVNMGTDYTGMLYLRSMLYRSHNKALLVGLAIAIILAILVIIWLARKVHRHRNYIKEHGLLDYKAPPPIPKPEDDSNKPIVG